MKEIPINPKRRTQKPVILKVGKIVGVAKYSSNITNNIEYQFLLDFAYGNDAYHFRFGRR